MISSTLRLANSLRFSCLSHLNRGVEEFHSAGCESEATGQSQLFLILNGDKFLRRRATTPNSDKIRDDSGIPVLGEEIAVVLGFFLS